MSAYSPDWSFITPILITLSVISAYAAPAITDKTAINFRILTPNMLRAPSLLRGKLLPLYPEVPSQLAHVCLQLIVGNHVDHLAALHHVVAVGNRAGEVEVLLDQQDGEALLLEAADGGANLLHDHGRQAFGRLIQKKQARARPQ